MLMGAPRKSPDAAELRLLIALVERIVAELPKIDPAQLASYDAHRRAARAAVDELIRDEGARALRVHGGEGLALAGIRATSTMGDAMMLVNWTVAAARAAHRAGAARS